MICVDPAHAPGPFPQLCATLAGTAVLGGSLYYRRFQRSRGLERAALLTNSVRGGARCCVLG